MSSDDGSWTTETDNQPPCPALDGGDCNDASESSKAGESESEAALSSSLDQTTWVDQDALKKVVYLYISFYYGHPIQLLNFYLFNVIGSYFAAKETEHP